MWRKILAALRGEYGLTGQQEWALRTELARVDALYPESPGQAMGYWKPHEGGVM